MNAKLLSALEALGVVLVFVLLSLGGDTFLHKYIPVQYIDMVSLAITGALNIMWDLFVKPNFPNLIEPTVLKQEVNIPMKASGNIAAQTVASNTQGSV